MEKLEDYQKQIYKKEYAEEEWIKKCMNCKHCYTTQDDDYIKCRLRKGVCKYNPVREDSET